ncbi:MAG: hypothetical protein AB7V44_06450 [Pseudonocardia sp.]
MISKVSRGWNMGGLLRYLMGPGRFNEHVGQRVVASWAGMAPGDVPVPRADPAAGGTFDVSALTTALTDPAVRWGRPLTPPASPASGKVPRGPVWHCSLRNHADDRVLSDAEWAEVVEDLMHRTGIAPRGDLGACRWVAIRHADDHVHVAAMLVRVDNGRRVHPRNDYLRAREACEAAEARLGLTSTAPADRTAVPPPSRAELEKAAGRGLEEAPRVWLRRAARVAAVQAQDPEEFFRRLADLGVLVRPKEAPPGQLVGYAVAAPDDVNADGLPVWYSGRRLARDLSLPQLVKRWTAGQQHTTTAGPGAAAGRGAGAQPQADGAGTAAGTTQAVDASVAGMRGRGAAAQQEQAAAVDNAIAAIEHATAAVAAGQDDEVGGIAHGAGDMAHAICSVTARGYAPVPWSVADTYDRATRSPGVEQPTRWGSLGADLRRAAVMLAAVRGLSGRRMESATSELVLAFAALVAEIAAHHERQRRGAQAAAARRSAALLREQRAPTGHNTGRPPGQRRDVGGPSRAPRTPPRAGKLGASPTNHERGKGRGR